MPDGGPEGGVLPGWTSEFPALRQFFLGALSPLPAVWMDDKRCGSAFNATAWEFALAELALRRPELDCSIYDDIPRKVRTGFGCGIKDPTIPSTFEGKPPKLDKEAERAIAELYAKEERLGRMTPQMSRCEMEAWLGGPFHASKPNCIPKSSGGWRAYADFSGPRTGPVTSRNALIDPDDFPSKWPTFDEIKLFFANLPSFPKAQLAVVDFKSYFRQFLMVESERRHFVVQESEGRFRANLCLDLGISSAPGIAGNLGDAIVLFLEAFFQLRALRWVDDIPIARLDGGSSALQQVLELCRFLGVEVAPDKVFDFGPKQTFFGFEWDIGARSISVPTAKREKYLARLEKLESHGRPDLKELQKLLGCLVHLSLVVEEGPTNMSGLFQFAKGWNPVTPFRKHHLLGHARAEADLAFWKAVLQADLSVPLQQPPPVSPLEVFTDASCVGIGVVIGQSGLSLSIRQGAFDKPGFNIGTAEAMAVEIALLVLVNTFGVNNVSIQMNVDNSGVVDGWMRRRSRNLPTNQVFIRILKILRTHKLALFLSYIATTANLADPLSREKWTVGLDRLPCPPLSPEVEAVVDRQPK
jgi:hypothetical protein